MSITETRTDSSTTVVSSGDVRRVTALVTEEVMTICNAAAQLTRDFDADSALLDVSLLVLNDVISAIKLQIYVGHHELVREYCYTISNGPHRPVGPPPSRPPLGRVPERAHVRLVVLDNPRMAPELREEWYRRLNWGPARPLQQPDDLQSSDYGTFASGGLGVTRSVRYNPKYDRPLSQSDAAADPAENRERRR